MGCNETAPYCSPSVVAAFVTPHTTNNHDGKRLLFCKTQKTAGPSLNMSDSTLTLSVEAVVDKHSPLLVYPFEHIQPIPVEQWSLKWGVGPLKGHTAFAGGHN